jgi:hypothetical protein
LSAENSVHKLATSFGVNPFVETMDNTTAVMLQSPKNLAYSFEGLAQRI